MNTIKQIPSARVSSEERENSGRVVSGKIAVLMIEKVDGVIQVMLVNNNAYIKVKKVSI